jgi:hypothetical protein
VNAIRRWIEYLIDLGCMFLDSLGFYVAIAIAIGVIVAGVSIAIRL